MKNLYIFYLLFIPLFSAYSIPVKKNLIKKHIQSDGDTLNVLLDGDEFFKIRKTSDNIIIKRADDGFFYYALYDTINNDLIPGKLLAHNPDKRNNEEVAFINAHKANIDSFISAKKTKKRSIYQKKPH